MTTKDWAAFFENGAWESVLAPLYGDGAEAARTRYGKLAAGLLEMGAGNSVVTRAGSAEARFFTAAGRTELCGNHTDHNRGKVLAASVQLDMAAAVSKRSDNKVVYRSTGFPDAVVDLDDLTAREVERGTTESLIRGVAHELRKCGAVIGGWTANADSSVPPGSGLSSSAALEVLVGAIFDNLYADGKRTPLEIARIGQIAENDYFGKPSGLMDQTACATGSAVHIDFFDTDNPVVTKIPFDPEKAGWTLAVVNTGGSHANLTPDYAAIPAEMKGVAAFFGKSVLAEVAERDVIESAKDIRAKLGDRALLRALHFYGENTRVDKLRCLMQKIAESNDASLFADFLRIVNESGRSSWELLQNVYPPHTPAVQGISAALALTARFLDGAGGFAGSVPLSRRFHDYASFMDSAGAFRVHGGGFAGSIQVYIPSPRFSAYASFMDGIFGAGSVIALKVRGLGVGALKIDIHVNF